MPQLRICRAPSASERAPSQGRYQSPRTLAYRARFAALASSAHARPPERVQPTYSARSASVRVVRALVHARRAPLSFGVVISSTIVVLLPLSLGRIDGSQGNVLERKRFDTETTETRECRGGGPRRKTGSAQFGQLRWHFGVRRRRAQQQRRQWKQAV